jgi:transposase
MFRNVIGKMRKITVECMRDILALGAAGVSVRVIASRLNVGKSTVNRTLQSHLHTRKKSKGGRPRLLSPADKRYCVRNICKNKNANAVTIKKALLKDFSIATSANTIRRALREEGLGAVPKVAKPMLTRQQIKNRLKFANTYKDYTLADWRQVIFTDESKINRFNSDGRTWAWVRSHEELSVRRVKQTVKHGGGHVMVWSCITSKGPGYLCKIDGNMDQHVYREILETHMLNSLQYYHFNHRKVIFQHDNDPKHTAKSIVQWLKDKEISVLTWPAQSPDLNPIEHMWAALKSRLNEYDTAPSGLLELWDRIQETWDKFTKEECLRYIESMPARIDAVLKAKGRWTSY